MGATGSRSSPATETLLVTVEGYSKLMRAPVREHCLDTIRFRGLWWDVIVTPNFFNAETGVSDLLDVRVVVDERPRVFVSESVLDTTDISIEILDNTGLNTVFHRESSRGTTEAVFGFLVLRVLRRELEASSCVRRHDDSFLVRCTLRDRRRPCLLGNCLFSSSKSEVEVVGKVDMSCCHTLAVGSLSRLKAGLLSGECAHSTRFAVGGSRWYLTLYPALAVVRLVRATKEDDETRTTAEFSFALEGAVNVQSEKMTHTFKRDRPGYAFQFLMPPSKTLTDRLLVRCCVQVIPDDVVVPTAVPSRSRIPRAAAAISTTVPAAPTESLLTPLLSAMDGGLSTYQTNPEQTGDSATWYHGNTVDFIGG